VLQLEEVGVEDNFFELGGDSLKVMQLMSLVGQTFEVKLQLDAFYKSPTIASLCEYIAAQEPSVQSAD
jgi:acyl carrier protein